MTDRDQVAREVLTEIAEHLRSYGEHNAHLQAMVHQYRDEHYPGPAPAAPVTVTVTVVNEWTLQRRGYFQDRGGNCTPWWRGFRVEPRR